VSKRFRIVSDINIILTTNHKIRVLNNEYRGKNTATDILSFNIDSTDILGELYISLEYVSKNFKCIKYIEEIYRLIIHGTLHLLGYDHKEDFIESIEYKDNMYMIQEDILNLVKEKHEINSGTR